MLHLRRGDTKKGPMPRACHATAHAPCGTLARHLRAPTHKRLDSHGAFGLDFGRSTLRTLSAPASKWRALHQLPQGVRRERGCSTEVGVATSARQVTHDTKGLDLTESDTECSWSLLSFGRDRSGYY